MTAGLAIGAGLAADRVLGEPPAPLHPVAWFGSAMSALERALYRDTRSAGLVFTSVGVCAAWCSGVMLERWLGRTMATSVAVSITVAGRMLGEEARAIGDALSRGDVASARLRLPTLVGRCPDGLDEAEISCAAIESVAENAVDAVIAPVMWAAIGGARGALAYRAVNTLDAMVGHRSPRYVRFGWSSARLDDIANWLPARAGALIVAAVSPRRARHIMRTVRDDASQHPSPNGGVIEAAFAAALGVRLGGSNRYGDVVEHRGFLGNGSIPQPRDIARAVRLLDHVTVALIACCAAASISTRARGV